MTHCKRDRQEQQTHKNHFTTNTDNRTLVSALISIQHQSRMTSLTDYVNDPRFSQTFELPANPASGRTSPFRVKYADYGYCRDETHPEEENVILFFGPLMASRLLHIAKDGLAKKHRIRIINPDRPGIGGTDAAGSNDAMAIWRGMLARLH